MVYRAPAENDDAKRDAAEVAEFAQRLHAKRVRVWIATGAIALASVGAFGLIAWLGMMVAKPPPPPFPPNCHEVSLMSWDQDGKPLVTRRIDCVPPGVPSR